MTPLRLTFLGTRGGIRIRSPSHRRHTSLLIERARSRVKAAPHFEHALALRQASVGLVRTLLPTAKGIRLLGVTVSNFEPAPAGAADELPLFGAGGVGVTAL